MGAIIVGFGLIGLIVLAAFIKFSPKTETPQLVSTFNKMVLGVGALLCGAAYISYAGDYSLSAELRAPMGIIAALGTEIVFLLVFLIVRNFFIFRPPSRPGL